MTASSSPLCIERRSRRHWFLSAAAAAWQRVCLALQVTEERRKLRQLDERMLNDLGISASQARFEASRLPWDPPLLERAQRRRRRCTAKRVRD